MEEDLRKIMFTK